MPSCRFHTFVIFRRLSFTELNDFGWPIDQPLPTEASSGCLSLFRTAEEIYRARAVWHRFVRQRCLEGRSSDASMLQITSREFRGDRTPRDPCVTPLMQPAMAYGKARSRGGRSTPPSRAGCQHINAHAHTHTHTHTHTRVSITSTVIKITHIHFLESDPDPSRCLPNPDLTELDIQFKLNIFI